MSWSPARSRAALILLVVIGTVLARELIVRADPLARMRRAWSRLPSRPVEGRLIGLSYGPRPAGASADRADLYPLRSAATSYLERSARRGPTTPEGGAAILFGRTTDEAAKELEDCARTSPANDVCWNDLAVAYLEVARQRNDARAAARALASADRALELIPGRAEALFNRAVALESLSLNQPAIAAWRRYLTADGDSQWAGEARARMRDLDRPTDVRSWENVALPRLQEAARSRDRRTVEAMVRTFPREARLWGERRFLGEWAEAVRKGDASRAAERLALAREVGMALQGINGEQLLADMVAAIDRAPDHWLPLLADAYATYGKARELYASRHPTEARPLFEKSAGGFRRVRSPTFLVAEYYLAGCLASLGETDAALESIARLLADVPAPYVALRAQLLWDRGLATSRAGQIFESIDSYERAFKIFDRQGEKLNAEAMRAALCVLYSMTGRDDESWRLRRESFREVSRLGDPRGLQMALIGAAGAEAINGHWDLALPFYSLSIERALEPPNPVQVAEAAVWRALGANRLGLESFAGRAVTRAQKAVAVISDEKMRASALNHLRLAEGIILRDTDPEAALESFTAIIDRPLDLFSLPEAYLERGRTWRKLQREEEAVADFRSALDFVDRREQGASADQLRDSYFATADLASEELLDLLDRRGTGDEVFAAAERIRARLFSPSLQPQRFEPQRIPEETLLVHYTALPERLIVFAISHDGIERHSVGVPRSALREQIAAFTAAIDRRDERSIRAIGRELHDLLVAPLGARMGRVSRIVIVPDATIAAVPFAALRTVSGAYLLEQLTIAYAPSASSFTRSLDDPPPPEGEAVLAVGDPHFDRETFPKLEPLPAAEAEAREVGKGYPSAVVLTGEAATSQRVIQEMQKSSVINLAAHAVLDARAPSRSALLLAPSGEDRGILYLGRISDLAVRARVVVLSGCRTAAVLEDTPPALRSFALAFLGAGSRNVIGALWDADDEPARVMSRLFHERLRAGSDPASALREAQLAMLRSGDQRYRAPLAWSGYQLYAGTADAGKRARRSL